MAAMVKKDVKRPTSRLCERCGSMSSQSLCQACALLDTLNLGMAKMEVGRAKREVKKASSTLETDGRTVIEGAA